MEKNHKALLLKVTIITKQLLKRGFSVKEAKELIMLTIVPHKKLIDKGNVYQSLCDLDRLIF